MKYKINIIQKLKFNLWYLARKLPLIGKPILIAGKISTLNFMGNYRKKLEKEGLNIFPNDRYKRDLSTPKQFYLVKSNFSSDTDLIVISTLLNHLRIPYSIIELSQFSQEKFFDFNLSPVIIGSKLSDKEISKIKNFLNEKKHKIIIFNSDIKPNNKTDGVEYLCHDPLDLFSFKLGLRSKIVEEFIQILFVVLNIIR